MPPTLSEVDLQKGEVLFFQGDASGDFFVLRDGAVEILISEEGRAKGPLLLESSRRMAVVDTAGAPLGEIGAILDERRTATVRALAKVKLLKVPAHGRAFREWLMENPRISRIITKALAERLRRNDEREQSLRSFEAEANRLVEGFSLVYALLVPVSGLGAESEGVRKEILARGDSISKLLEREGRKPVSPSLAMIERVYRERPGEITATFDTDLIEFLADAVEDESFAPFWEARAKRVLFAIERLAGAFPVLNTRLRSTSRSAEKAILALTDGPGSLVSAFRDLLSADEAVRKDALAYAARLAESAESLRGQMLDLLGRFSPEASRSIDALRREVDRLSPTPVPEAPLGSEAMIAPPPATGAEAAAQSEETARTAPPAKPLGIMASILKLDLSPGLKERFPAAVEKAEAGDNESARLATKLYWEIVPIVFKNLLVERRPEWVWFVRYGWAFDAEAKAEHLARFSTEAGKPGPILYMDDWLMKIYRGEVPPSRDELGRTYQEVVADRDGKKWSATESDPAFDIVRYEVEAVLSVAGRAVTGGRKGTMPCIGNPGPLVGGWIHPGIVAQEILKIIGIDFTAFYREVRVQLGAGSEFLPKEVVPRFILIPAQGARGVPWQEYEGKAKDTPGRIFLPLRPEGDFATLLLETIGRFRWILQRSVAGYAWADPVEGGLTGKYMDYVTFYKKNPELTEEMKAKVAEDFKNVSLDVDKFVRDYSLWVKYESQGIQRLNRVARRIFCEAVPFSIAIRKNLAKAPAFAEVLTKDSNKRRKARVDIERRVLKYSGDGLDVKNHFQWALALQEPAGA